MDARRLERCRRWLFSNRPILGPIWARIALRSLWGRLSPDSVKLLAETAAGHFDSRLRKRALGFLRQVKSRDCVSAVCDVWMESRHPILAKLIKEQKWVPSTPPDLRVFTALKTSQCNGLLTEGASVIPPLIYASSDPDREVSFRAIALLGKLNDPRQIEAACEQVIRMKPGPLHKLVVKAGYAPKDPAKRARFYFLTGQHDRYESLDFDHAFLRACYETGESDVRHAIAARIRASGRTDLTEVLHGRREKRQLAELTPREWETVVSVLRERKRHADLWALVFEAPPEWSAEILGILSQSKYRPPAESDRLMFEKLLKLRPAEGGRTRLYAPAPWCRSILRTNEQGVRSFALSPDGKILAAVNGDTTSDLWDLGKGALKSSMTQQIGLALDVAFSPDGRILAVGNTDNVARAWDMAAGRLQSAFRGHADRINSIAFSRDSSMIGTACYDNTARIWDLASKECLTIYDGHQQSVLSLVFSADFQTVATGSHDETARIWHVAGGGTRFTLTGNLGSICSIAYSPDGRLLATGSSDGTVRLWYSASGEIQAVLQAQNGSIMALAFSPDGTRVAAGSLDKTVVIWEVPKGKMKARLTGHQDEVHALAFAPDGKTLITGSRDRTIRIWQIAEQKALISMTREDLERLEMRASALTNSAEARPWHFSATLLRHRFRFDIELSEITERVLGEFEIEIEDAATDG